MGIFDKSELYSVEKTREYSNILLERYVIQATIEEDQLKMSFTNSINRHLDKVESNGIGLKSVKKMIEIHHGTFYQDETNDLFTIILTFPIHQ